MALTPDEALKQYYANREKVESLTAKAWGGIPGTHVEKYIYKAADGETYVSGGPYNFVAKPDSEKIFEYVGPVEPKVVHHTTHKYEIPPGEWSTTPPSATFHEWYEKTFKGLQAQEDLPAAMFTTWKPSLSSLA